MVRYPLKRDPEGAAAAFETAARLGYDDAGAVLEEHRLQAAGIARLAAAHGQGMVELTRRANLQLRGVTPAEVEAHAEALIAAGIAAGQRVTLVLDGSNDMGQKQRT